MTQLAFNGVGIDLGGVMLLDDVTFTIARGERWGVLGRNGSGKTTLFKLAAGQLAPSRGSIYRESALKLTLLDQHREFGEETTLWEAAATPFAALRALEHSLAEQAHALGDGGEAALERYGRDLERFEREGGYTYAARVDAILDGLGFDHQAARHRQVRELSGGERGRLALAQQLAAPADILLLDEPTNHLDADTTLWLERYLAEYPGAVLLITHDRYFLDRITNRMLEIERGRTQRFSADQLRPPWGGGDACHWASSGPLSNTHTPRARSRGSPLGESGRYTMANCPSRSPTE